MPATSATIENTGGGKGGHVLKGCLQHRSPAAGDKEMRISGDLQGDGRPEIRQTGSVTWDEATIAEHDKDRGTRTRIDEPSTPFYYPQDSAELNDSEDDGNADHGLTALTLTAPALGIDDQMSDDNDDEDDDADVDSRAGLEDYQTIQQRRARSPTRKLPHTAVLPNELNERLRILHDKQQRDAVEAASRQQQQHPYSTQSARSDASSSRMNGHDDFNGYSPHNDGDDHEIGGEGVHGCHKGPASHMSSRGVRRGVSIDSGGEDMHEGTSDEFARRRKAHYNEFKVLKELRASGSLDVSDKEDEFGKSGAQDEENKR